MPNSWSPQLGSIARRERGSVETRYVESLVVLYMCLTLLSLIDNKREFLCL
jgi:hypothetical protein